MKVLKIITNSVYLIIIIAMVSLAMVTAFSVFEAPGKIRAFVVSSGSMEPTLKTGSVVLVVPQSDYQVDDIITFKRDIKANIKDPNSTATHRIIEVKDDEGRATFTTKGDANQSPDGESVEVVRVLGKVTFSIPYIGKLVAFAKTQLGFLVLIIIPATLIVYSELMNIKKEILKLFKKKKDSSSEKDKEE
jgi:signal peptidase I